MLKVGVFNVHVGNEKRSTIAFLFHISFMKYNTPYYSFQEFCFVLFFFCFFFLQVVWFFYNLCRFIYFSHNGWISYRDFVKSLHWSLKTILLFIKMTDKWYSSDIKLSKTFFITFILYFSKLNTSVWTWNVIIIRRIYKIFIKCIFWSCLIVGRKRKQTILFEEEKCTE